MNPPSAVNDNTASICEIDPALHGLRSVTEARKRAALIIFRVGLLGATYSEYFSAAYWAATLGRRASVFKGYGLRITYGSFSFALETIGVHLLLLTLQLDRPYNFVKTLSIVEV